MNDETDESESSSKLSTKEQNFKQLKSYGTKGAFANFGKARFDKKENCFQSNSITLSYQEFSLLERKVWLFCINQVDRQAPIGDTYLNQVIEIPVRELNCNYGRLQQLCDTITSKKIHSIDKNGFGIIVPFPEAKYIKKRGVAFISLTMLSNVVPFFVDLKNAYTRFNLDIMLSMKSVYTQRIFEIIMMETNGPKKNVFNYNLEVLQQILGCSYDNYADLKRRVLEPAKQELEEKAGYVIEYFEVTKAGRKVVEVQFMIFPQSKIDVGQIQHDIYEWSLQDEKGLVSICRDKLESYAFGKRQRKKILSDIKLVRKFMLIDARILRGDIRILVDKTAYMAQSLGFGEERGFLRNRTSAPLSDRGSRPMAAISIKL